MKKIPTLFIREFENHKIVRITPEVTEGCESVLRGECVPTVKFDGSCTAIIDGVYYKRYDAKKGKKAPEGAIPCCEPDPITGHHPHWVKVDPINPSDKWYNMAFNRTCFGGLKEIHLSDGTYEAVGKHFNGNPYNINSDILIEHGKMIIDNLTVSFEGIRDYLSSHYIEGIVFWKDGEPLCKIKRTDFGFEWGEKNDN